ncbi:NADAR family protein [Streptomyces sp. SID14478]|uniref:NADAR family protein n=1 Tax=Streptomyces sp. SID14478 TaxID=2706073 RepID=UPI0013DEA880|nr:NADAR family protein [Streptomyces sp. SID14478]NEB80735.1 NADAR family protein [Streptomyces sp. SID14478]
MGIRGPQQGGAVRIDSRESLVTALEAGARVKYLHFWGHAPRKDGALGASCLSQWWPSPFRAGGVEYATAEHWMMARKARLFGDAEAERRALEAGHPSQAKKAGRLVRDFDDALWQRERFALVVEGSVHKFASDPALRDFLLDTGERVLVEASPVDRIWGIGLAADDPAAQDPRAWRGPNLLGFALMAARARLR